MSPPLPTAFCLSSVSLRPGTLLGALVAVAVLSLSSTSAALNRPTRLGPAQPAKVARVVTLAPSLTDLVLALGAGERLVGVSRFDQRPEVAKLPRVGGFTDPSVEAVVAQKPDLILVQPSPGNRAAVEALARLGHAVLVLPLDSTRAIDEAMREAGRALGLAEAGAALADRLEAARREIRQRAASLPRRRVLVVHGFDPLIVAGRGSVTHELLVDAGGLNVAESSSKPYPVFSVEQAVRSRPEVVIDAAYGSSGLEKLRRLPGLREARWVKLPSERLLHPGPELAQGLAELFELIHHPGVGASDAGTGTP